VAKRQKVWSRPLARLARAPGQTLSPGQCPVPDRLGSPLLEGFPSSSRGSGGVSHALQVGCHPNKLRGHLQALIIVPSDNLAPRQSRIPQSVRISSNHAAPLDEQPTTFSRSTNSPFSSTQCESGSGSVPGVTRISPTSATECDQKGTQAVR